MLQWVAYECCNDDDDDDGDDDDDDDDDDVLRSRDLKKRYH